MRLLKEAEENDIGIVARSIVLKGALTPRYRHLPDVLDALKAAAARLNELAGHAAISCRSWLIGTF